MWKPLELRRTPHRQSEANKTHVAVKLCLFLLLLETHVENGV